MGNLIIMIMITEKQIKGSKNKFVDANCYKITVIMYATRSYVKIQAFFACEFLTLKVQIRKIILEFILTISSSFNRNVKPLNL